MDLGTWVSLAAIGGLGLAILTALRSFRDELRTEFHDEVGALRAETRRELAELHEDVRAGFSQVTRRLDVLEQRTFDLGSRPHHPRHDRP
jgi:hypothetical protein